MVKESVDERGFAMVDVGDNRNVTEILSGHGRGFGMEGVRSVGRT